MTMMCVFTYLQKFMFREQSHVDSYRQPELPAWLLLSQP